MQLEAIFTMLASQQPGGSKLKVLSFGWIDLSGISPEILLRGIRSLEEFKLLRPTLTAEQVNAILCLVTEGRRGRINKIVITKPDILGTICPDLLQAANQVDLLEMDLGEDSEEDSDFE